MRRFGMLRVTRQSRPVRTIAARARGRNNKVDAKVSDFEREGVTRGWRPERCHRIALVFQGGGALGAYQAGVYEALHEAGVEPDWVCGVSIGAINSAIIAGNPPEKRLEKLRT